MAEHQVLTHDPQLGHRYIPALRTRVAHEGGGYLVRTNAAGFRSEHELTPAKPEGSYRVLLFGDSYTAGDGVSNAFRYSELLEQRMPGLRVENFGVKGTGTDQQYLIYREVAPGLEHDLVVISIFVENIRRNPSHYRSWVTSGGQDIVVPKPYFELDPDGELQLRNVPVPRPLASAELPPEEAALVDDGSAGTWRRQARRLPPGALRLMRRLLPLRTFADYDRADAPPWLLMRAILLRWIAESTTPVLVVPIPLAEHIAEEASPAGYQARFGELAASAPGAVVHDPLPDFLRLSRRERATTRFPVDPHFTRRGHEVLADSLEPVLRAFAAGQRLPVAAEGHAARRDTP